eukprot:4049378-Pyramimonas_sp.AAC.1
MQEAFHRPQEAPNMVPRGPQEGSKESSRKAPGIPSYSGKAPPRFPPLMRALLGPSRARARRRDIAPRGLIEVLMMLYGSTRRGLLDFAVVLEIEELEHTCCFCPAGTKWNLLRGPPLQSREKKHPRPRWPAHFAARGGSPWRARTRFQVCFRWQKNECAECDAEEDELLRKARSPMGF